MPAYVNDVFARIAGYSPEELVGQNHNIVRHPDMPAAAFGDLWDKLKNNQPWRGMVKNRCTMQRAKYPGASGDG